MKKRSKKISPHPINSSESFNKASLRSLQDRKWGYAAIFLFTCVIYGNTLWNNYTLDDAIVLTENIFVQKGIAGIKDIFTHDVFEGFFKEKKSLVAGGRYRPLSLATFAIEYELYGLKPAISHAINVVLFGITCVLIYYLFNILISSASTEPFYFSVPFLIAMFYAAHPIHTEAVANIKGRDEIMSMLFALVTLVGSVLSLNKGIKWLVVAATCFFLSLLSKENSITFVAIIPLTFYFFTRASVKNYIYTITAILIPTVAYLFLRGQYASSGLAQESSEILNNPFVNATFEQRYATPIYSFLLYYIKLVFPHPLTHDYYYNQIPLIEFSDIKFLSSALITLCLLGIALNQLKRKTLVSYGILYFFITFSVVSNLLFSVGIIMNERFLFMPSLGFCILLSAGFHYLYATKRLNTYALSFLAGLVVFLYSVKTIARNTTWKDNLTLFLTDVKYSPNSAKVNTSAGGDLLAASDNEADSIKRRQMIEESISYLSKALSIYPDNHNTLLLMGNAQYKYYKGADAALPFYKKIIELKKGGEFLAYQNAANLLYGEKRYEEAVRYYLGAVSFQPNNKDMLLRLSESYAECNKPDSALLYAVHTLQLHPEDPVVLHLIGKIYGKYLNRLTEAIPYLQKAAQLKPTEVAYLEDLGVAYGLSGNYDAAIETMNKILSINPNYKPAYINLSISYRNKGDIKTAEALMNKAMQLP